MQPLEKKAIFIPAVADVFRSKLWKSNYKYKNHDMRFFQGDSFFQYNYALTTTYWELLEGTISFRNEYKYPENYILIADSGGFQIANFRSKGNKIEVSSLQVLRWMEANADIGMNLDVPPWSNFNASLKESIENFELFEKNRINYDMKLYNVLHGKTLDEMKTWYSAVEKFKSFNGWALGVRPADNVYLQTLGYMFLHEKDALNLNTNFHMFGISGIKNMLVMAMLSNHFDSSITFDSSSYATGSIYRRFYFPKDIRFSTDFGRTSKLNMKSIPCNCPVCRNLTIEDLYQRTGTDVGTLLMLHNLYQYIEVNRMVNALVTDDYAFMEYAKSVGEEKTVKIVSSMIEYYHNNGCDKTYNKYKHLMTLRNTDSVERNMFSYPEVKNENNS